MTNLSWVLYSVLTLLLGLQDTPDALQSGLAAPVRIMAADGLIDVTTGHAAPLVMDFDGDGLKDLLVGEFGTGRFPAARLPEALRKERGSSFSEGKLRIYRNEGTAEAPSYKNFEYLRAGKEFASIPTT